MTPPSLEIVPFEGKLDATIRPPGSKSITNRALLCSAFARGRVSKLRGALKSDDSDVMQESLRNLGVDIAAAQESSEVAVFGRELGDNDWLARQRSPSELTELFVGNSGTTIRFLTAALAIAGGDYRLSGVDRMHQRPIGDLVDALRQLGVNIKMENDKCPPVVIKSDQCRGGSTTVRGNVSSQYLSGLLMAGPLADGTVEVNVEGELISKPYVEMTQAVMKSFGVECSNNADFNRFVVEAGQSYSSCDYDVEPDASAATYFWGAAAICGGTVKVLGLSRDSLQGDVAFAKCLAGMGCEVTFEDDGVRVTGPATRTLDLYMSDISDTVQTMSAVAMFLDGSTTIKGIAHNRVKETDRIGNLAIELRKLGAEVEEFEDGFTLHPGPLKPADIETYDDHRMAMSLSLVGLRQPGVNILDPGCVSKTYPDYFSDLESIRP